jgi:hypothetical protein
MTGELRELSAEQSKTLAAVAYAVRHYRGRSVVEAIETCAKSLDELGQDNPANSRLMVTAAILRLAGAALKANGNRTAIPNTAAGVLYHVME